MRGIVVNQLKIVYWPIPKVASTSLKVYFATFLKIPFRNPHAVKFNRTDYVIQEYFNFALVRNPYDRLWSLYNSWDEVHQDTVYDKYNGKFQMGMSWDEYVDTIVHMHPSECDRHFRPQYLQIPKGIHVERIEDNLILKILGMHNSTQRKAAPRDERIYEFYKEDFERFSYSK